MPIPNQTFQITDTIRRVSPSERFRHFNRYFVRVILVASFVQSYFGHDWRNRKCEILNLPPASDVNFLEGNSRRKIASLTNWKHKCVSGESKLMSEMRTVTEHFSISSKFNSGLITVRPEGSIWYPVVFHSALR